MSTRFSRWGKWVSAALVACLFASVAGVATASENTDAFALGLSTDALVMDQVEGNEFSLNYRYGPPPPRYRHYRVHRPYWRVRIAPPPVFAPGWFGFYFLGVQPPPPRVVTPAPAAPVTPPPRRQDFRHVGQYSLSVSGGAYTGSYVSGDVYDDPGVRLALSYRNAPVLGAELSVGMFGTNMRMDGYATDARSDIPIQMSAVLHAFPKRPIQPYLLFGATANVRTYRAAAGVDAGNLYSELRVGPHVGLGVELLVGQNMSIIVDGRSVVYTMIDRNVADETGQNDVMFNGGLNFYF